MSEFNFKSQVCTDRIQSERLLALGLKKETADMCIYRNVGFAFPCPDDEFIPAWSLSRLLGLLPDDAPNLFWILDGANISIECNDEGSDFFPHNGNIFNGIIDCIEWLIKEGYFNKEYLEE